MNIELPRYILLATVFDRLWPLAMACSLVTPVWMWSHLFDESLLAGKLELLLATVPSMLSLIASSLLRRSVPISFLERQGKNEDLARLLNRTFGPIDWRDLVSAMGNSRTAAVLSAQRRAAAK